MVHSIKFEARNVISKHTEAYMQSVNYKPESHQELYDTMTEQCAFILTEAFLNGEYTPMEYNALRNEVSDMLWDIFEPYINGERNE